MHNINFYVDFTSDTKYYPFYINSSEDNVWDYWFDLGNSGLFFLISVSGYAIPKENIYYSPATNTVVLSAGDVWTGRSIYIFSYSTAYTTYQLTTENGGTYLYPAGSNLTYYAEDDCCYVFTGNFLTYVSVNATTIRLRWKNVAHSGLKRLIFIDTFLWQWEDNLLYTTGGFGMTFDAQRFPLVKRNNVYYLTSETTFQPGWYYTLLMENGDCFSGSGPSGPTGVTQPLGLTGFVGQPNLGNGYLSIHGFDEGPYNTTSSELNGDATHVDYDDPAEPSNRDRYTSFGINSHQISFSPFTRQGLTGFVNNGNEFAKTPYSRSNPLVIWSNENNNHRIDRSEIYWLDQFHLWVEEKVYRIPLNWTVAYCERSPIQITREDCDSPLFQVQTSAGGAGSHIDFDAPGSSVSGLPAELFNHWAWEPNLDAYLNTCFAIGYNEADKPSEGGEGITPIVSVTKTKTDFQFAEYTLLRTNFNRWNKINQPAWDTEIINSDNTFTINWQVESELSKSMWYYCWNRSTYLTPMYRWGWNLAKGDQDVPLTIKMSIEIPLIPGYTKYSSYESHDNPYKAMSFTVGNRANVSKTYVYTTTAWDIRWIAGTDKPGGYQPWVYEYLLIKASPLKAWAQKGLFQNFDFPLLRRKNGTYINNEDTIATDPYGETQITVDVEHYTTIGSSPVTAWYDSGIQFHVCHTQGSAATAYTLIAYPNE